MTTSVTGGDPDAISRDPTLEDEAPLRAFAERYFPEGAGRRSRSRPASSSRHQTSTSSSTVHPDAAAAVVGAGFSGHGYKFCSVVGEILADLALDGGTRHDIGLFAFNRFE